ncbi:hypothetical protein BOSEA31B_13022 [Hyphomicrobiales bacterium]|nr:hypothetical protein BOSEA31B_13022 [Hyphomicrobiales bacterium]CAH1698794.1 hypothetical protein BOSEA1005_11847 [Hyphomicrobiales bacterium]
MRRLKGTASRSLSRLLHFALNEDDNRRPAGWPAIPVVLILGGTPFVGLSQGHAEPIRLGLACSTKNTPNQR